MDTVVINFFKDQLELGRKRNSGGRRGNEWISSKHIHACVDIKFKSSCTYGSGNKSGRKIVTGRIQGCLLLYSLS